jgi:hypothetical protein
MRHLSGLAGFAGFLVCAWFAYQCGEGARNSASRAYGLWLSGSSAPGQVHSASRENGLCVMAMAGALLLGLTFLSTCFWFRRRAVLRRGVGFLLLASSCLPFSLLFTILSPLLNIGRGLAPGARVTTWSTGGITLHDWQMYAGVGIFGLATLSMLAGGVYLLLPRRKDD